MTQRIFDMENEQDYTELFKLFSPEIKRIKKLNDRTIILENYNGIVIDLPSCFNIKWGNLTYVDRPVDKSKWIGCLCFLSDCEENIKEHVDILTNIEDEDSYKYYARGSGHYKYCRPVKRSEIKFVEDND